MPEGMSEQRRRAVFAAVVAAQDRGMPAPESRRTVAEAFGITPERVTESADEGIRGRWPPPGD